MDLQQSSRARDSAREVLVNRINAYPATPAATKELSTALRQFISASVQYEKVLAGNELRKWELRKRELATISAGTEHDSECENGTTYATEHGHDAAASTGAEHSLDTDQAAAASCAASNMLFPSQPTPLSTWASKMPDMSEPTAASNWIFKTPGMSEPAAASTSAINTSFTSGYEPHLSTKPATKISYSPRGETVTRRASAAVGLAPAKKKKKKTAGKNETIMDPLDPFSFSEAANYGRYDTPDSAMSEDMQPTWYKAEMEGPNAQSTYWGLNESQLPAW